MALRGAAPDGTWLVSGAKRERPAPAGAQHTEHVDALLSAVRVRRSGKDDDDDDDGGGASNIGLCSAASILSAAPLDAQLLAVASGEGLVGCVYRGRFEDVDSGTSDEFVANPGVFRAAAASALDAMGTPGRVKLRTTTTTRCEVPQFPSTTPPPAQSGALVAWCDSASEARVDGAIQALVRAIDVAVTHPGTNESGDTLIPPSSTDTLGSIARRAAVPAGSDDAELLRYLGTIVHGDARAYEILTEILVPYHAAVRRHFIAAPRRRREAAPATSPVEHKSVAASRRLAERLQHAAMSSGGRTAQRDNIE